MIIDIANDNDRSPFDLCHLSISRAPLSIRLRNGLAHQTLGSKPTTVHGITPPTPPFDVSCHQTGTVPDPALLHRHCLSPLFLFQNSIMFHFRILNPHGEQCRVIILTEITM